MHNVRKINDDIYYLGANDRRIALFENVYPVPNGMSYNNYLIKDEKTCLMDGIDESVSRQFLENLTYALGGKKTRLYGRSAYGTRSLLSDSGSFQNVP